MRRLVFDGRPLAALGVCLVRAYASGALDYGEPPPAARNQAKPRYK
jgi:hypothetical protein